MVPARPGPPGHSGRTGPRECHSHSHAHALSFFAPSAEPRPFGARADRATASEAARLAAHGARDTVPCQCLPVPGAGGARAAASRRNRPRDADGPQIRTVLISQAVGVPAAMAARPIRHRRLRRMPTAP
jgi:hypothetical protein